METKLRIYMLITNRYKDLISEKEHRSISEIRQRCSPYTDFIRNLRDKLLSRFPAYDYRINFSQALPLILDYINSITNFEFSIPFWMTFEEMDKLRAAPPMDKAILLTALFRSADVPNPTVLVAKNKRVFVSFEHDSQKFILIPETGSVIKGPDSLALIRDNPLAYEFNDLKFEQYE
ncbi:MAG: hypothetical protein HZA83_02140 [Thaumarchaeota archaeon]|nr:hypothetical protein [Nitrososphaerota archaeon]